MTAPTLYNPLPRLGEEEYETLKLDIEANGILDPIEKCAECSSLLDGHHRLEIAGELDIKCPSRTITLPVCSPEAHLAYAWKRNLSRRQLPVEAQMAWRERRKQTALALRQQGLTQAQVAALVGVDQGTVSRWADASNMHTHNANTPTDNRRKLTDADVEGIIRYLAVGHSHSDIADSLARDVQISRSRVSQIASQYADRILDTRAELAFLPCTIQGIQIRHGDARDHNPDDLADLAFFSPPYNVGIAYDEDQTADGLTDAEWQNLVSETMAVLRDGWQVGRIVVNVPAALDRNPYRPVILPDVDGLTLEAVIVWDKGMTGNRTSWGSWRLPTEPRLRDRTERLYVYRTGHKLRGVEDSFVEERGKRVSRLLPTPIFTSLTQDVWAVPPESAQRVGHPAPFPVKLAENVIRLFGWEGCTVIDPFGGSGTTGVAAAELGCKAVLIDRSERYCRLAIKRLILAHGGANYK